MKSPFFFIIVSLFVLNLFSRTVYADTATDNAINYLKAKQDATGQITGGSTGDASPWAAIAFSANGIDPSTLKNLTNSLLHYLQDNHPATSSAATEWEKWILAITASGQNPYNFGGVNYVATLESPPYYKGNQLGDISSLPDDWFGVLALIASGVSHSDPVLTNSVSFILSHQNTDGGFGYSTTASSDSNDTAAAIQALVAAKNNGVTTGNLDVAIANAKTYFLSTQDKSGGFLYDTNPWTTAPDSDSTTWALMALNVLGMQKTDQTNNARMWLRSHQAGADGGFTACNQWDPNTYACTGYASNSTTTAHALIGLADKGWIITIFNPSLLTPTPSLVSLTPTPPATLSATPTVTPTAAISPTPLITSNPPSEPSPTVTPTPTATPLPTNTPIPTATPTPTPIPPTSVPQKIADVVDSSTLTPPPPTTQKVLGVQTTKENKSTNASHGQIALLFTFLGIGFLSLGAYGFQNMKRIKHRIYKGNDL